ncbi:trigger factor [Inquilinus limosus]|uniref:trigger factor n=1 Tax=Inquilinus limosus TaxID=171674 RepID=UPI003F163337
MQVIETSTEGLRHEFKIVVPAADIEQRVQTELVKLAGRVKLPGFRPGKVPVSLMKQRYGKSVMGEVLEGAVDEGVRQALDERKLRPALRPKVEVTSFDEGKDLEYKVDVEVLPEITAPAFDSVEIERPVAEVTDEQVDAGLQRIAETRRKFEPLAEERGLEAGDTAVIDFEGSLDGAAPSEEMSGKEFRLEIGSNRFIPGFEDQLIGKKAGEHVTVSLTFPEEYPSPEHAGKPAKFEVDVKAIEKSVVPEVNEDFAKELGFEDLEGLRNAVKGQTEQEFGRVSRLRAKRKLLDKLAEMVDFAVPQGMVDLEFDQIWKQVQQSLETAGDDNPDKNKPEDELKAEYRAIAERRVRLGLLFAEVGRAENVEVTQEELNRALIAEARRYPGQEQQVVDFFRKNPQAIENLRAPLFEEKVVDVILGKIKVNDTTVTPEELARDPDEEEAGETKAAEAKPAKKKAAKSKAAEAEAEGAEAKSADTDTATGA